MALRFSRTLIGTLNGRVITKNGFFPTLAMYTAPMILGPQREVEKKEKEKGKSTEEIKKKKKKKEKEKKRRCPRKSKWPLGFEKPGECHFFPSRNSLESQTVRRYPNLFSNSLLE